MPAVASPRLLSRVAVSPSGSRCGRSDPARGVRAERRPPGTVRTAVQGARLCRAEVGPRSRRGNALVFRAVIPRTRGKHTRDPVGEKRWRLQPGRHIAPGAATFSAGSRSPASESFCWANNSWPKVVEREIAPCTHLNFPSALPPLPPPPPAWRGEVEVCPCE